MFSPMTIFGIIDAARVLVTRVPIPIYYAMFFNDDFIAAQTGLAIILYRINASLS